MQAYFENLHVHEMSMFQEQEDNEYESDLEQQQGCKYDSHLESDSSTFAYFSMDKDACLAYDQFSKHVEHIITDDCIDSLYVLG
jgi:hypothetical protein